MRPSGPGLVFRAEAPPVNGYSNCRHLRSPTDSCIMRTRQETRHLLISGGLLICVLILIPLLLSLVYEGGYFGARWGLVVCGGGVGLFLAPYPAWYPRGWDVQAAESSYLLLPHVCRNASNGLMVLLPLWPLVVAAGAGVVLGWRRYGPVLPGHCGECAYDLTGNAPGRCPECGTYIVTT